MAKPSRYSETQINQFVREGYWQTTISDIWDRNADKYPTNQAIADLRTTLSWRQAKTWTDCIALNLLELGFERDNIIVVQLPNSIELHLLRVACEKAGVLCMPVTANMRKNEISYILKTTRAKGMVIPFEYRNFNHYEMVESVRKQIPFLTHVFVAGDEVPEHAFSIQELSQAVVGNRYNDVKCLNSRRYKISEVSIINLTTGSTGFPKFVEYPAGANAAWGEGQSPVLKLSSNDIVAAIAPAARGPSLPAYYDAPWVAAKIIMLPWEGPDESFFALDKFRATVVCLVPTQLSKMLGHYEANRYDLKTIRLWYNAGALISASLVKEAEERIGGIIVNDYGAVDFGGIVCSSADDNQHKRMYTVGKPRFGTEIEIVDENGVEVRVGTVGEILGRGPTSASGYYNDASATKKGWDKDGWFAMGDLGKFDEDGYIVIIGRKKNIIIRGAQNIYPGEVEELLRTHPKIKEAAVVGMPDDVMGERVCAYLVLETQESLEFEEMIAFLRKKNIASFKLPERLEIIDNLPLIAEQKVDLQALRKDIENKLIMEKNSQI